MEKIPLSEVTLDDGLRKRVMEVLDSGRYILDRNCREFEERFSAFVGRKHGVLANSATSAMHLTLMAMGIGSGHEVIVPSHTAFPTVEPIYHCGARPVFVDIRNDYLIDSSLIEEKITQKTAALLPVHLYGSMASMDEIMKIAGARGLPVLEDSCQAHGAEHHGRKAGAFGHAAFFSFYPSKNMTFLGDGGIMVTDDGDLAQMVRMLRDHGRREKYLHEVIGYNMRANEIQAAIGLEQLARLDEFNERRRAIACLYNSLLGDLPLGLPRPAAGTKPVYHMYVIRTARRDALAQFLKEHRIETGIHYPVPCHLQPAVLKERGAEVLPETERACREILSLPLYPGLSDEKVRRVAQKIEEFFEKHLPEGARRA
ncbi:MAG: DegT/DnrJ/EryC1/StrS family aminotransferase [Candidatus Eremiobacteraeota bacterium]|nr:DegT/DnrJ/EryC1/StrS family aminotransferase [Candidatus Eremiobacteraeota bacterium]